MREENESSPSTVTVCVNGTEVRVPRGAMLAAVLLNAGAVCRVSESGEPRTALCGMGICFECRATVNGVPHQRSCQIVCSQGMTVQTQQ
jgi:D-hydroxyproline dehydrogenase subunit gamma